MAEGKQKAVTWPCGVCGRGIGNNSIQCTGCQKWVHRKCSGIKGSMYKVMKTFICTGCVNPVTGTGCTSVDIDVNAGPNFRAICLSHPLTDRHKICMQI